MKPQDFAEKNPTLDLFAYFDGSTKAWGIFEDRFGTLRREFVVDIVGTIEGNTLTLDEDFTYSDGEKDRRIWTITDLGDNRFEGRADDILGTAQGVAAGNALNWSYDMMLTVGDSQYKVHFNDWMFLQSDDVLINRAKVSKWGLEVGSVTLFFKRP